MIQYIKKKQVEKNNDKQYDTANVSGWRRTAAMDVSDNSTTDVVDVVDDTPRSAFDDDIFVPGGHTIDRDHRWRSVQDQKGRGRSDGGRRRTDLNGGGRDDGART